MSRGHLALTVMGLAASAPSLFAAVTPETINRLVRADLDNGVDGIHLHPSYSNNSLGAWNQGASASYQNGSASASQNSNISLTAVSNSFSLGASRSPPNGTSAESTLDYTFLVQQTMQITYRYLVNFATNDGTEQITGSLARVGGSTVFTVFQDFLVNSSATLTPGEYRLLLKATVSGTGVVGGFMNGNFTMTFVPEPVSAISCGLALVLLAGGRRAVRTIV